MANKKPVKPLLEKCPQCQALPGIKCQEQGFVLESVHMARHTMASIRQTPAPRAIDVNVLMVHCPRCGAMPRRTCAGPPPMRDPKPYHKERYLEKFRLEDADDRAKGRPPRTRGRPWLDNRETPDNVSMSWRDKQALREQRDEMKQDDE